MRAKFPIAATLALMCSGIASASETTTYSYDAKGRLMAVSRSGGPNSGVNSTYAFDAADNRISTSTTGSQFSTPPSQVVVVPLGGLKIIVLPQP